LLIKTPEIKLPWYCMCVKGGGIERDIRRVKREGKAQQYPQRYKNNEKAEL
jgi:hypothetical protein